MLKINQRVPDFKLPDQESKLHKLSSYRGKWVLLYFYPKDDTPGCTKEACAFRDNLPKFEKLNCRVLGISVDSVKKHERFALKYNLPFTLLSDEDRKVVEKFGVWQEKKFMGRSYFGTLRQSFLVDPQGRLKKIYIQVKPETHAEEVLLDLEEQKRSEKKLKNKIIFKKSFSKK